MFVISKSSHSLEPPCSFRLSLPLFYLFCLCSCLYIPLLICSLISFSLFLSYFIFTPIISIPYVHSASSLATCLYLFGYLFFLSFFLIIHIFLSCLPVCLCLSLSTCLSLSLSLSTCLSLSVSLPVCLSLYLPPLSLAPILSNKLKSRKRKKRFLDIHCLSYLNRKMTVPYIQ